MPTTTPFNAKWIGPLTIIGIAGGLNGSISQWALATPPPSTWPKDIWTNCACIRWWIPVPEKCRGGGGASGARDRRRE